MDRTETHRQPPPVECCVEPSCKSGLRNTYYEGKRLTPDSFTVEQRYHVERRHLLNRAIHGWGVVYGYGVTRVADERRRDSAASRLRIGPGLALDKCGRELVQTEIDVAFRDLIFLDQKGKRVPAPPPPPKPVLAHGQRPDPGQNLRQEPTPRVCWLLSVHYAEQPVSPVPLKDPCSCTRHEWDRVCETVRFSLTLIDCQKCCKDFPCELHCDCATGPCCEEHGRPIARPIDIQPHGSIAHAGHQPGQPALDAERPPCKPFNRGGCQCLCEHLTGLKVGDDNCRLCEIEEPCGHIAVDLWHGVPLACVSLVPDECDQWTFGSDIEACGPRQLVKRNDLLFDLIRGCDLTHISDIGWKRWHRYRLESPDGLESPAPVPWLEFARSFGPEEPRGIDVNVTSDYWVEFSRPVRADTVRPDCFAITVLFQDRPGGWWMPHRVPIVDVITDRRPGVDPRYITRATLVVEAKWVRDEIYNDASTFIGDQCRRVEIEVFGDYIVDCNGQTVDANVRGFCAVPSGNGTPGGTLRSSFQVGEWSPLPPTTPVKQGA